MRTIDRVGLNLDIARRYWSPASIITLINLVADKGGNSLHLHASDDQAYGLESVLLGQTAAKAQLVGTKYVNPRTGKGFLTRVQLASVIAHAATRGVDVMLEIDTPGHAGGIRRLMDLTPIARFPTAQVFSDYAPKEIEVHSSTAWAFVRELWGEVLGMHPTATRVHLGGDEFAGSVVEKKAWAAGASELAAALATTYRVTSTVWNDAIVPESAALLSRSITVAYWDYDDWGTPGTRLTMPAVASAGFTIHNYNGYYCYWVPRTSETAGDRQWMCDALRGWWTLGYWGADRTMSESHVNLRGACFSIWGEQSASMSEATIISRGSPIYSAFASKVRAI
ncbi:family 20 glycosylhydrolase [Knoellia sp. CPCC 206453]|uniref:family 20 glycosylhydrolase n=1 Tax=Knoellia pratensis TaxID=3404796 RepID=UPI00360920D5